jgi:hypothetical protein
MIKVLVLLPAGMPNHFLWKELVCSSSFSFARACMYSYVYIEDYFYSHIGVDLGLHHACSIQSGQHSIIGRVKFAYCLACKQGWPILLN